MRKYISVFLITALLFTGCASAGTGGKTENTDDKEEIMVNDGVDVKEDEIVTNRTEGSASVVQLSAAASAEPAGIEADKGFIDALDGFSGKLFIKAVEGNNNMNLVLSPLSVYYALSLASNGSDGETRKELEGLLGGIEVAKLNGYLYELSGRHASTRESVLKSANSVWANDGLFRLSGDFMKVAEKYYSAESDTLPFGDVKTIDKINSWVNDKTGGLIPKLLDELDPAMRLILLNTVYFNGEWLEPYDEYDVTPGWFTNQNDEDVDCQYMHATEYSYFETKGGVGFSKAYKDGYSFVAVLPDGDVNDFVKDMNLADVLRDSENGGEKVKTSIPKFDYESTVGLNSILKSMGADLIFSGDADFRAMSADGESIFIDTILQKAKIKTDEKGTVAAAVTEMLFGATALPIQDKEIHLTRPFFYAICDMDNIPVFLGVVYDVSE